MADKLWDQALDDRCFGIKLMMLFDGKSSMKMKSEVLRKMQASYEG